MIVSHIKDKESRHTIANQTGFITYFYCNRKKLHKAYLTLWAQ